MPSAALAPASNLLSYTLAAGTNHVPNRSVPTTPYARAEGAKTVREGIQAGLEPIRVYYELVGGRLQGMTEALEQGALGSEANVLAGFVGLIEDGGRATLDAAPISSLRRGVGALSRRMAALARPMAPVAKVGFQIGRGALSVTGIGPAVRSIGDQAREIGERAAALSSQMGQVSQWAEVYGRWTKAMTLLKQWELAQFSEVTSAEVPRLDNLLIETKEALDAFAAAARRRGLESITPQKFEKTLEGPRGQLQHETSRVRGAVGKLQLYSENLAKLADLALYMRHPAETQQEQIDAHAIRTFFSPDLRQSLPTLIVVDTAARGAVSV